MKLNAVNDRIIFKRVDLEFKTKSGIILGEIERTRDSGFGRVIATGNGKKLASDAGVLVTVPMEIKEGDLICFNERIPMRANYKGEDYYVIREADVFFTVEDEEVAEKAYSKEGTEYEGMIKKLN